MGKFAQVLSALVLCTISVAGSAAAQAAIDVVSARDGYQVAYSIAEVDTGFSNQVVLIADRRDGKPLLPDTGPLQIIVPNDKRAARWLRQLTSIEVRQLK